MKRSDKKKKTTVIIAGKNEPHEELPPQERTPTVWDLLEGWSPGNLIDRAPGFTPGQKKWLVIAAVLIILFTVASCCADAIASLQRAFG